MSEEKKAMKNHLDSLTEAFRQELLAYEKERPTMTKKALELRQRQLGNKQQQLNGYQAKRERELKQKEEEVLLFEKTKGNSHG